MIPSWWSAVRVLIAYAVCLGLLAGLAFAGVTWFLVLVAL